MSADQDRIFTQMSRFFDEDEWVYEKLEGESALGMGAAGNNGEWGCVSLADAAAGRVIFYSVAPFLVEPDQRAGVMEYLTRANYGLGIGNFEMDLDDGEVRFKTSLDIDDAELTVELMRPIVYMNVQTMDRYIQGLVAVSEGADPVEAIAQAESEE